MRLGRAGICFWRLPAFFCLLTGGSALAADPALIEYPSVHAALQSLLTRRDVKIEVRERWSIIKDAKGQIWTFVPLDHPAYPSVMRQRIWRGSDGVVHADMAVLCEAEKMPCEAVTELLRQRNRETAADLKFREMQQSGAANP